MYFKLMDISFLVLGGLFWNLTKAMEFTIQEESSGIWHYVFWLSILSVTFHFGKELAHQERCVVFLNTYIFYFFLLYQIRKYFIKRKFYLNAKFCFYVLEVYILNPASYTYFELSTRNDYYYCCNKKIKVIAFYLKALNKFQFWHNNKLYKL